MAHSHKDGHKRGGHRRTKEIWGKRGSTTGTNCWTLNKENKQITHRIERRIAKVDIYNRLMEE